jgi:hypothetical protein
MWSVISPPHSGKGCYEPIVPVRLASITKWAKHRVFRQGKAPAVSSQICAESASGKGINYSAQKLFRSIGGLSPVPFKHPDPSLRCCSR